MKRNDKILLVLVFLFSMLFYRQSAGVNYLLFASAIIAGLLIRKTELIKSRSWITAAAFTFITSFCTMWYGNGFCVFANFISLTILAGISTDPRTSVIFSFIYTWFSYWLSVIYMIVDYIRNRSKEVTENKSRTFRFILVAGIPLVISCLFISIYREANPFFNEWAAKINLDWLSIDWLLFTLFGFIMLYGFFHQKRITSINEYETQAPNELKPGDSRRFVVAGKEITVADEILSGVVLLVSLNVLLLFVNILDFNFLFIDHRLPAGVTFSEFVHQGIGAIILSIIFAIIIILFYFRGDLNFYTGNKKLKMLAYLWILQNVIMLVSTAIRNDMYIDVYGLTYKRIGVYVYLILAAAGLITTLVKIALLKTNMFLFRINSWICYLMLTLLTTVNWDLVITDTNLTKTSQPQVEYLLDLGTTNIPELLNYKADKYPKPGPFTVDDLLRDTGFANQIDKRLYRFLEQEKNAKWQSYCFDDAHVLNEIKRLSDTGKITYLDLSNSRPPDLMLLKQFSMISGLDLSHTNFSALDSLKFFPALKRLDLSYNRISSLEGIENLKTIQELNLTGNVINDLSPVENLPLLNELFISERGNEMQIALLKLKMPDLNITVIAK